MSRIICTVTNDLSYDQRMQRICTSLASVGHKVLLVGRRRKSSTELLAVPYKQHRIRCIFNKGKLFYIEYNIRLFFFLLNRSFDLLCSVDLDTILPCYMAARLKRKRVGYDAHEYFTGVPELVSRPLTRSIWKLIEKWLVPKMAFHYTVNESLAKLFKEEYKIDFTAIYNVPKLHEGSAGGKFNSYLLYQGAMNEGRGLQPLIRSMHHIDRPLWIAGEGDLSTEIRNLVEREGLMDKVTFLGLLSPDKLRAVTCEASIGFNLMEQTGSNNYYSLANKFFDYMFAGVPSISPDFPEYKRIIDLYEVGLLVNGLEESTIADAVNSLLNEKGRYDHLIENCLAAREHFNWRNEENKLIKIYKGLES